MMMMMTILDSSLAKLLFYQKPFVFSKNIVSSLFFQLVFCIPSPFFIPFYSPLKNYPKNSDVIHSSLHQ